MNQPPFDQIRILVTGGTIDKTYSPVEGVLGFSRTHVIAMLQQGRVPVPEAKVETVLLKDSLEMTDADLDAILRACSTALESRLLIDAWNRHHDSYRGSPGAGWSGQDHRSGGCHGPVHL